MRSQLPANAAALVGSVIMPRDFVEIEVKDRATGASVFERFWSDGFDVSAPVVDLTTGASVYKTFYGASGLVSVDDIPMGSDLSVQECNINFSAYGVDIDRLVRLYDAKMAPVRIWRGFLNTSTREIVAAAESIFVGEIDDVQLPTGADGEEMVATITCLSSQELTRWNPDTRSNASQKKRSATCTFFKYAASVGDWTMFWGQKKATIDVEKKAKAAPSPKKTDGPDYSHR